MKLEDLLQGVEPLRIAGDAGVEIEALTFDSRKAERGSLFFALEGEQSDGHDYIGAAVERGAAAVVCQRLPQECLPGVTYVVTADSHEAMGRMASAFYGYPSRRLKLVGVTGTNGKTTTATLLYDLFRGLGYKAGLISTVVYRIDTERVESTHTTPDALTLNRLLAQMADRGCDYCFMEVSSHSVVQRRIAGLEFAGGIFTNITHDHLDYHKTFAEYIRAKKLFFDGLPAGAFALTNIDDRNGRVMVQNTAARVSTLSLCGAADFRCRIVEMHLEGMELRVDGRELWVGFLGRFNAYNTLSVYAAAVLLGADREEVLRGISALRAVSGRFEAIRSPKGVTAIVDYAHTPDALQNVIDTINEIRRPGQKLYVVVGCGGNRDATKRPVMAAIAAAGGDLAVFTSDNPRKEDPDRILAQMREGVTEGERYLVIRDRREAIRTAVAMAAPGDIVLVAGKGHENYQIIGECKSHFDDHEEVAEAFKIML
ncbi:MAG: UDP-N-acetylmuramoyl-L-alanyl-D-glutamate--2,6-diaminopimelate ligase [Rikenellaceae bacterium]|nr:UDP-N-acetylmuramoyl-L-alanyl-D-glutamate--2,6-diaminopimelate ligase [Rikenellaceae bacterium]